MATSSTRRSLYHERLKKNLCPTCGNARDRSTKQCSTCVGLFREATKKSDAKRKKKGTCRTCPAPVKHTNGTYCQECLEKIGVANKRLREGRRERGTCLMCPSPRTTGLLCLKCWFEKAALRTLGSRRHGAALQVLFERQQGLCFYTGEKLTPGKNASIDHQTPKTTGGTDTIGNLKWVTRQINRIKNNLSHEDFVQLCSNIAARFR